MGLCIAFGLYYLFCLASAPVGMKRDASWNEPGAEDHLDEDNVAREGGIAIEGIAIEGIAIEDIAIIEKEAMVASKRV